MIRWKYIWPYLLVISTIGALAYINIRLISKNNLSNYHTAGTINEAGKQRMLSQQLVTGAMLIAKGKPFSGFQQDLISWNENHRKLVEAGNNLNPVLTGSKPVKKLLTQLDPIQHRLFTQLAYFATGTWDTTILDSVMLIQATYLPMMNDVVENMTSEAETHINIISKKEKWQIVISGLILIIEILLIVVPYHRRLLVAYRKLKEQKLRIQEQSEEIALQNEMLEEQNKQLDKMHRNEALTLKGINAGVWSWNVLTGEEEWSPRFFALLGYEPDQITANFTTFMNILLHPDDVARVQKALDAHLQHDEPYKLNIRMRMKNGHYRWFEAAGQAEKNEEGTPVRMAGSVIDIEDKMQYQQQLESLNQTKDKLFAIVAHDLRSPITGIRALLDMAGDGQISREEFAEYIGEAKENITYLSETLDNLLQWAMGQMQGITRKPEKIDLRQTLNTLTNLYKNNAAQKDITMKLNIAGNHFVYADTNQVFIAIRNMLSNAIKFTGNGGKITIDVLSKGGMEEISITDTGIGISMQEIDAILNKKQHGTRRVTNDEKGTGLGLTLSVDTVRENGGEMHITSMTGIGSTFTISLPRAFA